MTNLPPAGWYSAPHANGEQRYWDGQRWIEPVAPSAPTSVLPSSTGPGPWGAVTSPSGADGRRPAKGWAITALVLGIAAFLLSLIPWLGLLLGLAAVGSGVMALVRRQSKPLAITGTALGSVALVTSLVVTIAFASLVASPQTTSATEQQNGTEVEESPAPTPFPAAPSPEAPAPVAPTAEAPAPAPAEPVADGSVARPLPQPYTAKGIFGGEKYTLTGRIVSADAGQQVYDWNQFNDPAPAGFKYVIVELTLTGIDPDGVEPSLADFDLYLATSEGNRYSNEYIVLGDDMPQMSDGPTLYPGNSFTGYTAYVVPASAQSFLLYDNGRYVAF